MTSDTRMAEDLSRRRMFGAAAAVSLLGQANSAVAADSVPPGNAKVSVRNDGTYETVPLKKDAVDYALIQNPVLPVDPTNPKAGIKENLARMRVMMDKAVNTAGPPDLLSFHEFPIAGYAYWTRSEMQAIAIELPGPETDAIAAKAREYGCWITFGCYARDKDWPGHVLMLGVLMNPKGEIVAKHWKARGSHGRGGAELITTTVFDTLPRYVDMYGWDAVVPVARTEVGNISITGVQYDPLLFTVMALKGCEISVRQATGSNPEDDAIATSKYNAFYTALVSNSVSPGNRFTAEFAGAYGITQIIGPNGQRLAKANSSYEEIVRATIPLATFRKTHLQPDIQWEMYAPVFAAYRSRFAPGEFLSYLPPTMQDSARYFKDRSRWR